MAQPTRSRRLFERAQAAMLAAIEVYNKPTFEYREETFAILAINAWELLLKARYLHLKKNVMSALYIPSRGSAQQVARNRGIRYRKTRSGANFTVELKQLVRYFAQPLCEPLPDAVQENISGLVEIRDVAVHLSMPGAELKKRTLEFAAASVSNFVELGRQWFGAVFEGRHVYMLPIGLIDASRPVKGVLISGDERRLVRHLSELVSATSRGQGDLAVAIPFEVKLVKADGPGVSSVRPTSSPDAPKVVLEEKNIRAAYKWDYYELTSKLRTRYSNFVANAVYHRIRKPLHDDARYVRRRELDPGNPKSAFKDFYHPDILGVFDGHYSKK